MIISHKHQYLFVEVPQSASVAVRLELQEYYDGTPILHQHASYAEFLRTASQDERDYFVFATIRNPLDVIVSRYFKYKTDHGGVFSDPDSARALKADYSDRKRYDIVQAEGATFEEYFHAFHRRPFVGADLRRFSNFIMRYELLQEDFSEVLHRLGIEQVRSIPVVNRTSGRSREWHLYYTAGIIELAKRNFGPFMEEWGYEFPADWGPYAPSLLVQAQYRFIKAAASYYTNHIRYGQGAGATLLRRFRARLLR